MGQCAQKAMAPPILGTQQLDPGVVQTAITKRVGNDVNIILWDSVYQTIEQPDVQNFIKYNANLTYILNRYDCDDFSISLCARVREWVHDAPGTAGVCFGIMTGDLRLKANDPARPHAVCFFIDSKLQLWIADGMWNSIYLMPDSFTVSQVIL